MASILLLIAGGSPDTEETAIQSVLTGAGHTVTTRTDTDSVPANVTDYDCIVSSENSSPGAAYSAVAVPAVIMSDVTWRAMGMGAGTVGRGNDVDIEGVDAGHPIAVAAGLSAGVNVLYSQAAQIDREDGLGVDAAAVGYHAVVGRITIFSYQQGDTLADSSTAPANRVGFGYGAASVWTALGQSAFLASVSVAIGGGGGGGAITPLLLRYINNW